MELKFGFYILKIEIIWILHPEISNFGFYLLKIGVVWILCPEILFRLH